MRHTKQILTIFSALLLTAAFSGIFSNDAAGRSKKKKKDKTEQTDSVKTLSNYEKLFKNEQKKNEGFITVHLKEGKVYFEIPDSIFGRDLLMGSTVKSISNNAEGIVGSKNSLIHFTFTRKDSTVFMRRLDSDYITNDGNIESALSKSRTSSVMRKFPVKTYSQDSTALVIDATEIFLSDDKELKPFSDYAVNSGYRRSDSFKKNLSFVTDIKSFEDNLSVTSSMTYTYSLEDPKTGKKLVDKKNLTAELNRSVLLLPETVYHPRTADPRIGFFFTKRTRFGSTTSTSRPEWFVNRWRLEPSDTLAYTRGETVEPVKPITFYIDSDFPQWWKPYIRDAVEQWNEVFEEIGFKNAVVAKDFPEDDPSFDPENIKYSCIRYAPIGVQNAMGPSWTDPRSGEIINASVYVYHDVIKLLTNWMFVQTAQADPRVRTKDIPEELLGDALMYVIKHEVGHTLGLMHNMSASSVIPVDSLRSPSFTEKYGTTTSIMDYARFNYVAQPGDFQRGVKLTPPRFGSYDKWAIRWGYKPIFGLDSFEEETAITTAMISDSLKAAPFYRYGKQQMTFLFFDPSCQTEDLGDDVLKASKYGIANLKYIVDNFMDWIPDSEDMDYEFRLGIYNTILNQYIRYMNHLIMNIGGLYRNESLAGDPYPRFANVPAEKQRKIMEYVLEQYDNLDWIDSEKVLSRLPIVGKPSSAIRGAVRSLLFMTPYMSDMTYGVGSEEYGLNECMDRIFDFVWKTGNRPLTPEQRILQKAFVETYMSMVAFKMPSSSSNFALCDRGCCSDAFLSGELNYDPVSGFEWLPRTVFSAGSFSHAFVYSVLDRAYSTMSRRKNSANADDKAHYELLMDTIAYSLKNVATK